MGDKQSQQGGGRANGPIGSVADGSAVEETCACASQTGQAPQGWTPVDREPPCAGGDPLDSAERGPLAGFAGGISASFDLLAAIAGLGGAGYLAESLARVSKRVERPPAVEVERIVLGRGLRPPEKRASGTGKTNRANGPNSIPL